MDWFLYERDLLHERVNNTSVLDDTIQYLIETKRFDVQLI